MYHKRRNAKYKSLARLHPSKKNTNMFHRILCICIRLRDTLAQPLHSHRVIHISFPNHLLSAICILLYFECCKLKGFLYRYHSEDSCNRHTRIHLHIAHYFVSTYNAYYHNQIYNYNVWFYPCFSDFYSKYLTAFIFCQTCCVTCRVLAGRSVATASQYLVRVDAIHAYWGKPCSR